MVTNPDEIVDRLSDRKEFQLNLEDVFNEDDLEKAIEKSFDASGRRDNLVKLKDDLFDTDDIKDTVVDNSKRIISESKSLDELTANFNNISANLGDVGKVNEGVIQGAEALRERELTKEKGTELTREELLDLGVQGTKFTKSASRLGLSQSDFRIVLEEEGFTINEKGTIKK